MSANELKKSWAVTLRHLAASRYYLPEVFARQDEERCWATVQEYLHHNELGLALDEAEELGLLCSAPPEFWTELLLAAIEMGLIENAKRIQSRL